MSYPVFYVPAGDVLPVMFSSYAGSTGASVTLTGLAVTDIEIYKDGSATQRASDAGYTLLDTDGIDFDAITGIHGFSIDTGDNTDAGFYTVGAWFTVVVSAVTVDSQTVSFIACQFRLMAAESIAGKPKVDVDGWLGTACATPTVAGVPEVDLTHVSGATTNVSALATNVDAILTDTADMQPKLGTPAGASVSADIAAVAAYVDTEVAAILAAVDTEVAAIKAKTDNLPAAPAATGDIPTAAVIADAVWDEARAGHAAAGSFGEGVASVQGNVTGNVAGSVGSVTGAVGSVTGAVGSVTGNVGGNVVGSVASVTAGVTVATGGIPSGAHAAAELNAIADAVLDRNMASGVDSGTNSTAVRTPRQALRALRNKVSVAAGTATVTKEDDTTTSWTTAIATTAGNPISSSDPS